jgi:hypothetical protein
VIGWLMHTAWEVVHHVRGVPRVPFAEHSSLGCAMCDPVIAVWCLAGGPAVLRWPGRRRDQATASSGL